MGDDHKIEGLGCILLAVIGLVAIVLFWEYSMQQSILDQKLSIQCVEQGGTPLYINGHMSCLHKIARIA